ncbi:MAG: zeta toxin family protein [Alphaproteobacteria bacterium]|nr:zeta toxin family protein [Alphaproteobacteria bacterium]
MRHIIQHNGYVTADIPFAQAEDIIAQKLSQAEPVTQPYILHMLGVPGAGKSTFVRGLPASNAVVISFDDIMEKLPQYANSLRTDGPEKSFTTWEKCAREIGYELLFRAVELGLNIIFDHGGARADHVDFLAHIKHYNSYTIRIMAILADTQTASARIAQRERHVPVQYVSERMVTLKTLLPRYRSIADQYEEYGATPQVSLLA